MPIPNLMPVVSASVASYISIVRAHNTFVHRTSTPRPIVPKDSTTMTNPLRRPWYWLRQWFTTAEKRPQLRRNDPCWCSSGKKYKRCHMDSDMRRGTLSRNRIPAAQREFMERSTQRMEKQRERLKAKKK